MIELSVVLPVFNEAPNLPALHASLTTVLDGLGKSYEIVYVDDGSADDSFALLRRLAGKAPHVRLLRLRRNYGQTAAISAGVAAAAGQVLCVLDADLQNDPRDIPRLLAKLDEGYDVVSGWRRERRDPLLSRRLPSWLANRLISWLTGVPLHDYGCTLKAYRRAVLQDLRLYGEMHRLIPAFAAHEGARVGELPVAHHPRRAGRSSYGLGRTLKVVLDLIVMKFLFGYATKPIYVFGAVGIGACLAGTLAGLVTVYEKLALGVYVHRNPLILLAVFLFLLGVQCVLMGLIAELLIRTYHESQRKPTYALAERVNCGDAESE
ncbi:MAG TPA: glycosyltransferase family 2 protein [Methylomirabilota bacterium]|nr:glycosyltransferase family 2 protein [Methylomirabilota bacterium]